MKIYSIAIEHQGYDTYDAHIIVANNEREVIQLAQESPGDEGKRIWEEKALIRVEGDFTGNQNQKPFIMLSSFNAG